MTNLSFSAEVWTPRWGHTDTYSVKMTDSEMVVSQGMHNARCTLGNNGDPQWDGENQYRHPLFGMFNNEKIYPPEILPRALEWACVNANPKLRLFSRSENAWQRLCDLLQKP